MSNKPISDFHDYGIYFPSKTLKIFGEIDDEKKDQVISNLHALDKNGTFSNLVTILLSSEGGNVDAGLAIYDAIRAMKSQVRIILYGECSSVSSVIFQAADEGLRYMTPNSYLMLHESKYDISGKKREFEAWQKLQYKQEDACNAILLKRIKEKKRMSKKRYDEMISTDWILSPKEAINYGLADSVIEIY